MPVLAVRARHIPGAGSALRGCLLLDGAQVLADDLELLEPVRAAYIQVGRPLREQRAGDRTRQGAATLGEEWPHLVDASLGGMRAVCCGQVRETTQRRNPLALLQHRHVRDVEPRLRLSHCSQRLGKRWFQEAEQGAQLVNGAATAQPAHLGLVQH